MARVLSLGLVSPFHLEQERVIGFSPLPLCSGATLACEGYGSSVRPSDTFNTIPYISHPCKGIRKYRGVEKVIESIEWPIDLALMDN